MNLDDIDLGWYILDENKMPVKASIMEAAKWLHDPNNKIIERTEFAFRDKKILVSTVFLGINHAFMPDATPILFETMIFGLEEEYQTRACYWPEAKIMHQEALEYVKNKFPQEFKLKAFW